LDLGIFAAPDRFADAQSAATKTSETSLQYRSQSHAEIAAIQFRKPTRYVQAIFCRRRHQPRRPPPAKIRPGKPTPTMGPQVAGSGSGPPTKRRQH